eukprot:3426007-Prorocentrum_lima.AAC.1
MERFGLPPKYVRVIASMYRNPEFRVDMDGRESNWYQQCTGIRQGCPLSPYLFIILMTVMYHDVHQDSALKLERQ